MLRAFGAVGPPVLMPGGQGTSWRAGDLVLKPVAAEDAPLLEWLGRAAASLQPRGSVRVALPVPAADGRVLVDGWAATRRLDGAPPVGRWAERADVARAFARAFGSVDPVTLPARHDRWARADRIAWGEEDGPLRDHPLTRAPTPSRALPAVVHGDLAGNTLFSPGLPPAVIDLSLYARPVEWSVAVLAVDVVAFEAAPAELLRTLSADPDFPQLLARALLFRMVTDELWRGAVDRAYLPVVDAVLALLP